MQEPIDLSPELAREQRLKDMLLMRELEPSYHEIWNRAKQQVDNVASELSIRLLIYINMFPYSLEFKIHQTLQDFNRYLIILQSNYHEYDLNKPLAMIRASSELVYLNHENNFVTEKPKE